MDKFKSVVGAASWRTRTASILAALIGLGWRFSRAQVKAELAISGFVIYNMVDRDSEDDNPFQLKVCSESRFMLAYSKLLENGMTIEVIEEIGFDNGERNVRTRRGEVVLKAYFGGIRLGQGNDTGDGVLKGDFSGTAVSSQLRLNRSRCLTTATTTMASTPAAV